MTKRIVGAVAVACSVGCSSGPDALTDNPLGSPHSGVVLVQTSAGSASSDGFALAEFTAVGSSACVTTREVGDCVVQTLTSACTSSGPWVSAGTVSLGDTLVPLTLDVNSDGAYQGFPDQPLFTPGSAVGVNTTGSDAPAFATTFPTPALAIVSAPSDSTATIDRAHDLAVAWTGGSSQLVVSLANTFTSSAPSTETIVECSFDAGDGTGTIPTAALEALAAGSASFSAETLETSSQTIAGWTITFDAGVDANGPDGVSAEFQATLL